MREREEMEPVLLPEPSKFVKFKKSEINKNKKYYFIVKRGGKND